MSDIDTLCGIAEWAAYNAHGNIFHSVLSMINKFNVEGIDTRSNLYQRSKFFSVVERLDHMNYLDRQSFSDVVTLLDELQNTWGDSLLAKGIHQFKWLNRRHDVIVEMGIGVLRGAIGLDGSECPGQLNDIHVLSSFGYESYVRVVKDLFESHRKYLEGSCDDKGDIETENEMITQSITDLCDILVKPKATKKGDKSAGKFTSKLSKVKLRILLDKHSLKQTSQFVLDFVRHVQELVLPIPILHLVYESRQSEALPQNMRSPDWTEAQRRTSGPYASENDGDARGGSGSSRKMSVGAQPSSSTDYGSNVTSSSNALKKGRVGQNKDVPTSSSPSRSRQVANASLDHPTPGTLTKAQTEFNIKVGMKDPLPDILSEMALAPVASRIVHRRSNRITESNLREVHISAPKSPRKIPISGGVAEQGKDQIKEKEEEIQDECTDDDVATEDQDTEWHERSRRVIKTERRSPNNRRSVGSIKDLKTASQQKKQLHELDHYMDSSNIPQAAGNAHTGQGHRQGQGHGGSRKRLADSRPSAERVEFDDFIEENLDDVSESDYHNVGILKQLQRMKSMRTEERAAHPARLESAREHVVARRRFSKEANPRRRWTHEQVLALEDAVAKYGPGRWAEILDDEDFKYILEGRTNVNLKDKYRNMYGDLIK